MRRLVPVFAGILFLIAASCASSQIDLRTATARAGVIENPWNQTIANTQFRFYPEVQLRGQFLLSYLNWGVSWGYWSDGIDRVLPIMDAITYSYKAHIVSFQIAFEPSHLDSHFLIPLDVIAGVAEHLTSITYVGGSDQIDRRGEDRTIQSTTGIFGIRLAIPLGSRFGIEADALQFVPFTQDDQRQSGRREYLAGITITL